MPYEIAFPTMGIQWKTAGGSDLLLGSSWRMALPMISRTVAATATPAILMKESIVSPGRRSDWN